ncbi:MAG: phage Gp37/Gp68 family protein [Proteobacteria bacterium]|nr:phage Gp37/Gp68 family protein [Pseudomonadota bacterium]MBU4469088.1 phage Gp37/Gp68 family protein [Pseudomonadota bacterium]MCG2751060.1 phage Gp37/Gp68 family protein [Desulfobacteraceae bacterium]
MSTKTSIEWTEQTWNPTVGCTKISPGCANCYAEVMARRLKAMGMKGYENGFELSLLPDRLKDPLKRKQPTTYFVNSMSDLFHEKIPDSYIEKVFSVIRNASHHNFQVLTKRAERMAEYFQARTPPRNAWLGVTVENRTHGLPRLDHLRLVPSTVRFVSAEPLLEDLGEVDLTGIHWVIVGGESGPKARPMKREWALNLKSQCDAQGVAFFFKQWGVWGSDGKKRAKKQNGRLLDGRTWDATPIMMTPAY